MQVMYLLIYVFSVGRLHFLLKKCIHETKHVLAWFFFSYKDGYLHRRYLTIYLGKKTFNCFVLCGLHSINFESPINREPMDLAETFSFQNGFFCKPNRIKIFVSLTNRNIDVRSVSKTYDVKGVIQPANRLYKPNIAQIRVLTGA